MKSISTKIKKIWNDLWAVPVDTTMENQFERYRVQDPHPIWHNNFTRGITLFFLALALAIPAILYIKTGSTEGTMTLFKVALWLATPFIIMALAAASIHKKINFAKSLQGTEKQVYMKHTNRRASVMITAVILGIIIVLGILVIDRLTKSQGLF